MDRKAIAIMALFVIFYLVFGAFNFFEYGKVNNTQDFDFHFKRVSGIDENPRYLPGYHFFFSVFGGNQFLFYTANVFLICAVIPALLYFFKKNWWTVAIYFCGVPLAHQLLYGATYPQALILACFACYLLFRKDPFVFVSLALIASFTHNLGFELFLLILGTEILAFVFRHLKKGCLSKFLATGYISPSAMTGPNWLVSLFLVQVPGPVFAFGVLGMKSLFFAVLSMASFLAATFDYRAISIMQIVFSITAAEKVKSRPLKLKIGFALFLLAQLSFYLLDYAFGTWKFITLN